MGIFSSRAGRLRSHKVQSNRPKTMASKKKNPKQQTKVKKSAKAKKLIPKFSPKPKRTTGAQVTAFTAEEWVSPSPFPITPSP